MISKFSKGFRFLFCVINIFSKYAWVVPLKDTKGVSIVNGFQSILEKSNRKPNKIWIDKGSEFYSNSFEKWLQNNDIVMYSTYNEGKSVVAERFIRTLKHRIYKYMTKSQVGDDVRISKYKIVFGKDYTPNWSEEIFVVKRIKNTIPCTNVINGLNCEEIIGTFYD